MKINVNDVPNYKRITGMDDPLLLNKSISRMLVEAYEAGLKHGLVKSRIKQVEDKFIDVDEQIEWVENENTN